jgi:predicted nucleotide-binding protein
MRPPTFNEELDDLHRDLDRKLRELVSIKERLPLYDEAAATAVGVERRAAAATGTGNTIFVVHGRNEAPKLAVHGFLREITDANAVILHDQADQGRTIIEKFEDHSADAVFAVVVLTGDDVGGLATESTERRPRARQNVVFELGFFFGELGRNRVAILFQEGVELPSDLAGLLYIPLDDRGAWKLALARELKAAGVHVDADKLI